MGFASFFSTAALAAGFLAFLSALCPSSAEAAYSGTGTFKKISASADVTDGYYVIGEAGTNTYVMNDTHNGTYFDKTALAPTSNQYVNPSASIVWKIETNGSGKTIFSETQSKYISHTGSDKNVQFVPAVSDNERWTITFNASSQFEVKNVASSAWILQYNSSAPRFCCYTTAQKKLMLYKLDTTPTDKTSAPSFLPGGGTYNNSQSVTLNCGTADSTIYYTTDNSTPTNGSAVYSTPIAVTEAMTIKAFATSTGLADSDVSTADYSFKCATPTFNPVAGSFSNPQTVAITAGTSDTVIYYTLDNSAPSTESAVYSEPIALSATTTIKAVAKKPGYSDSDVAVGTFKITAPPSGFFEDFETMTGAGAYTGAEATFATGKWQVYGYTTMDSNDRRIDNRSIRMRAGSSDTSNKINGDNMVQMNFDKPNGLGVVSFCYGAYSNHSGGTVYVQYSTDQGATWKECAASVTATGWSGEMASASVTINVSGNARIRLIKKNQTGNTSLNVDNVSITDCSENTVPTGPSQQQVNMGDGRLATIDFQNVVNAGTLTVSSTDLVAGDVPAMFKNPMELAMEKYTFSTTATGWTADLNWTLKNDPPAGSDTAFRVVGGAVVGQYPATIVGRSVTVTGVTGFSDWYVGLSTALPVALSGFELE